MEPNGGGSMKECGVKGCKGTHKWGKGLNGTCGWGKGENNLG